MVFEEPPGTIGSDERWKAKANKTDVEGEEAKKPKTDCFHLQDSQLFISISPGVCMGGGMGGGGVSIFWEL